MLALGSALLRQPALLLLDEPSTGLAPLLVDEVFAAIVELRRRYGLGMLIVDQNARKLFNLADRVIVLKAGEVAYAGRPAALGDEELWKLF